MPCTTWTCEEFPLYTNKDGTPSFGSLVQVALDITYHRDGEWHIDTVGFINGWERKYSSRSTPIVEWFPEPNELEAIIIARAESRYREDIDEYVRECLSDDASDAEDYAYEAHRERVVGL